jgi:WD40 repeat protein
MVKELHQFDSGLASANKAIFDKSNTYVLVASEDATVKVYYHSYFLYLISFYRFNLHTKEKEAELKGHEDAVLDLTFDNGREGYLVSSSSDCSFRVWQ